MGECLVRLARPTPLGAQKPKVVDHGIGLLGSALSEQPSETVVIERETVAVTG